MSAYAVLGPSFRLGRRSLSVSQGSRRAQSRGRAQIRYALRAALPARSDSTNRGVHQGFGNPGIAHAVWLSDDELHLQVGNHYGGRRAALIPAESATPNNRCDAGRTLSWRAAALMLSCHRHRDLPLALSHLGLRLAWSWTGSWDGCPPSSGRLVVLWR
jgi:hypothetical protein